MKYGLIVRTVGSSVLLALSLAGCGGSSTDGGSGPKPIPVVNPDPNYPLKDVGLENEAENVDKLKAGTGKPQPPKKSD